MAVGGGARSNFPRLESSEWLYYVHHDALGCMEAEQSQNFNERLSQWVSSQGFWFQLRYSLAGSGTKGNLTYHVLRLSARLLVFLFIAVIGLWVYMLRKQKSPEYADGMRLAMQGSLSATDSKMTGYTDSRGNRGINHLVFQGGEKTFFTTLEARNIRFQKGFIDEFKKTWDPGTVAISRLELEIHAGADDATMAQNISTALFRQIPSVKLEAIEVAEATLRWGYSERTRGSIEGSKLNVLRGDGFYKLTFRGGLFTQNWLRELEITEMIVNVNREGISIEKAEFTKDGGTAEFANVKVLAGERPAVKGTVKLRKMDLKNLLPSAIRGFVEGALSGNFELSGSTNSSEGIGFKGLVMLDGEDTISMRERLHILKALSVIDYFRNYHRVDFREGQFTLKTNNGGMEITDLNLKADDLFTMAGSLRVRLPTPEEAQATVDDASRSASTLVTNEDEDMDEKLRKSGDRDVTLKAAGLQAKKNQGAGQSGASASLSDQASTGQELRYLQTQAADRASRTLHYEGNFDVTLPENAFERTPRLSAMHPADPVTKRIPLEIPIEGSIYEITLKQSEELYLQGKR